jgi:SAM-dependent methyltransferase
MDIATYAIEAEIGTTHWWFLGRRTLFAREIGALRLPKVAHILDVGTSTGTNLRMLAALGYRQVLGLDVSDEAIRFCAEQGFANVRRGDICALPFADGSIDLVLATDIIEHVENDGRGLAEIARVLAPGGHALITVPAFQSLWGPQDEVAHHRRRYRRLALRTAIEAAGLHSLHDFYFNYLLFAPIWLARQILRLCDVKLSSEGQINTALLNQLFSAIFYLDVRTAPWLKPPFGVSILLLAEKPAGLKSVER